MQAAPGSSKSISSNSSKDAKAQRKVLPEELPGMCRVAPEVKRIALMKMFRDAELHCAHNQNNKGCRVDRRFGRTCRLRCRKAKA